jgi:hypothetical protein
MTNLFSWYVGTNLIENAISISVYVCIPSEWLATSLLFPKLVTYINRYTLIINFRLNKKTLQRNRTPELLPFLSLFLKAMGISKSLPGSKAKKAYFCYEHERELG